MKNTILTIVSFGAFAAVAQGQQVVNGSFELLDGAPAGATVINGVPLGWTGSGVQVLNVSNANSPTGGDGSFYLENFGIQQGNGSLSQVISGFTVGERYALNFSHGLRGTNVNDLEDWTVSIAGQSFGESGNSAVAQDFVSERLIFTAGSTSETLAITFNTPSATGGALDGFSIQAIPEPSSALLLGLGGIGFLARRKRA